MGLQIKIKKLEQVGALCEEQTGALEHGGLINNGRARSETMGPLELAGAPDEEVPIAMPFFVREIDL